jgi:hypothetical protein
LAKRAALNYDSLRHPAKASPQGERALIVVPLLMSVCVFKAALHLRQRCGSRADRAAIG